MSWRIRALIVLVLCWLLVLGMLLGHVWHPAV